MLIKVRSWKNIFKILCAIPIALIVNIDCFLSSAGSVDMDVSRYFMSFFVGEVTYGDTKTIVYAMENLTFVLLFIILFGNSITEKMNFVPAYYFTRIRDRGKWFVSEAVKLSCKAFLYGFLYCVVLLIIAVKMTGQVHSSRLFDTFMYFYLISSALMIIMTILVNVITLKTGVVPAFIAVSIVILSLCICAISCKNEVVSFLNPLSYMQNGDGIKRFLDIGVAYDYILAIIVIFAGCRIMKVKDI